MQIVINIDDDVYKRALVYKDIQLASNSANDLSELITAVANGTPLPKGHGRLVDEKDLSLMTVHLIDGIFVCTAPIIIEADKEVENDRKDCPYRQEENGNCLPVGGFCLAVTDDHCKYLKEVENDD